VNHSAIAGYVFLGVVVLAMIAACVYFEWRRVNDSDREVKWNRAMSELAAHLLSLGYDVDVSADHLRVVDRDRKRLTARIGDFSPSVLLATIKASPIAPSLTKPAE